MKDKTKRKSNQPARFKGYLVDTKSNKEYVRNDTNVEYKDEDDQLELSRYIVEDWAGLI